nr:protein Frey 1 isoform X2 [Pongo pygmaeus]
MKALCEVALGAGNGFRPARIGATGARTRVGDGSRHAGGSAPPGWAQPLPPPHPGSGTASLPASETMASSPSTRGREGLDPSCPGPSSASGTGPTLLSITTMHTYDPRPS